MREKGKQQARIPHSRRRSDSFSYPNRCEGTTGRRTQRWKETKKEREREKDEAGGPTEIEAPVLADELQRVHQLTPTQRLCRGYFHNVERQSQRKEQRVTGRGHLFDLQHKTEQKTKSEFNKRNKTSGQQMKIRTRIE